MLGQQAKATMPRSFFLIYLLFVYVCTCVCRWIKHESDPLKLEFGLEPPGVVAENYIKVFLKKAKDF